MLRPERMSKVSVTGSKAVMDDVVETVHGLNLVHVSDYDGSWEGFDNGTPDASADPASEKLVTVRSLESILDIDPEDAGPNRIVTDDALEEELEEVRVEANELDDRRDELTDELRGVEDRIDSLAPFAELGIDLDLLSGYDTLEVVVGEGEEAAVRDAISHAEGVRAFETFSSGSAVAAFVAPSGSLLDDDGDEDATGVLDEALVGVPFTRLEIPEDAEGSPEEYLEDLEHRKQQLESKLSTVEDELDDLRLDAAGFLLAAEEKLSIEVQKAEAPLSFATTENAFVAEGWVPTEDYDAFVEALRDAVGDRVEIEELERASFDPGHGHGPGTVDAETVETGDGREAVADGGTATMDDSPPVVQNNPEPVKPFELLVQAVGRPKYTEFDPTIVVFLTFPAFFGYMIGDLGYGLLYTAIGAALYKNFDSAAFRSLGGITVAAGVFTALFGLLYGEIFGLHMHSTPVFEAIYVIEPPLAKGLQPAEVAWARGWLVISVLVGILHLNVGWTFDLIENYRSHGLKDAILESASWIIVTNALWYWVFSSWGASIKPEFVYTTFDGEPFALGFAGFQALNLFQIGGFDISLAMLAMVFGAGLLIAGEPIEGVEVLNALVNVLSYTRIAAVLLAKAGMAFTVNLLFFGVFTTSTDSGAEWHFAFTHPPSYYLEQGTYHGHEVTGVLFGGLMHSGVAMLLVGLLVLVVGHALVLALGVTSAGLQAVRLEYVEFFGKFYEGGGEEYEPFGYEREFTTDE